MSRYLENNEDAFYGEAKKYRFGETKNIRKAVLLRHDRLCRYELRALLGSCAKEADEKLSKESK